MSSSDDDSDAREIIELMDDSSHHEGQETNGSSDEERRDENRITLIDTSDEETSTPGSRCRPRRATRTAINYNEQSEDDDGSNEELDEGEHFPRINNRKPPASRTITKATAAVTPESKFAARRRAKRAAATASIASSGGKKAKRRLVIHIDSDTTSNEDSDEEQFPASITRKSPVEGSRLEETDSVFEKEQDSEQECIGSCDETSGTSGEDEESMCSLGRKRKKERSLKSFYCCPVCYVESYRRLDLNVRPQDEVDDDPNPVDDKQEHCFDDIETSDFQYEPMEILRCVDPTLELTSLFCFRKLTKLKHHLRIDHAINPNQDLIKNDLFHRFHVSGVDGLAQRYLRKARNQKGLGWTCDYFRHVSDDLKRLYGHRKTARRRRHEPGKMAEYEKFLSSFSLRGHRIWRALQQAYSRDQDSDSEDTSSAAEEENIPSGGVDSLVNREEEAKEEHEEAAALVRDIQQKYNLSESECSEVEESEGEFVDEAGLHELIDSDNDEVEWKPRAARSQESKEECNLDGNNSLMLDSEASSEDDEREEDDTIFCRLARKRKRIS
jgi:hypothetical protein